MTSTLAAVALAAGQGTRLRPISYEVPKVLCPVGDTTLIDHALDRLFTLTDRVAVNVHAHAQKVVDHLGRYADRSASQRSASLRREVMVSREGPQALGTAGALAQLRPWIGASAVLAVNADTYCTADLNEVAQAWDGTSVLVAHTGPRFEPGVGVVASITPPEVVAKLRALPSGLFQTLWKPLAERGELQTVSVGDDSSGAAPFRFFDCGTPRDLWEANMAVSGGGSVLASGAVVEGDVDRAVVFPGGRVEAGESLSCAIRLASGRTIWVR